MKITIISARGTNGAIGKDNQLLWHLPEDMKLFRTNTRDRTMLMGRNTALSIRKPLSKRRNLVLTSGDAPYPGVEVVRSLHEAIELVGDGELCIIGGSRLYAEALPLATELKLTFVDDAPEADAFFPKFDIDLDLWENIHSVNHMALDGQPAFRYGHYILKSAMSPQSWRYYRRCGYLPEGNIGRFILEQNDDSMLLLGREMNIGHLRGEHDRLNAKLDEQDVKVGTFTVKFAVDMMAMSGPYFLGLFGPSIRLHGSRDAFLHKYKFEGPEHILSKIDALVETALSNPI